MFWIKLLILNLILITSTIIGITFSKKYAYRVKELQEMKNALNIFMTKIKFTYEPIPSTFMYISEKVEGNVCKIFKNAFVRAAIPEAHATEAIPPSSFVILFSNAVTVGFATLV